MEKLGIQKVDLGLPGAGPFHREHINAMLSHITENDFQIRPGAAVRTLMQDIEPVVEMQQNHGIPIQLSISRNKSNPPIYGRMDHGKTHFNHGKSCIIRS